MLTSVCLLLLAQTSLPKNGEELVRLVEIAYRNQKAYQDEWTMTGPMTQTGIQFKRSCSSPKERFEMLVSGQPILSFGTDGTNDFGLSTPGKMYYVEQCSKGIYEKVKPPKPADSTFAFGFDSTGIAFVCPYPIKVISLKSEPFEGKPSRHLIAEAINPTSGGRIEAHLRFWPNAWIPTDVDIRVFHKGQPGEEFLRATSKIKTGVKLDASIFKLDPTKISDFSKVSYPDFVKALGLSTSN